MISDRFAPPQGPRGWDLKNGTVARGIHVSNLHTKSGWISGKMTPQPLWYPQVPPLGDDQGGHMKIPSDMFYIFHFWEDTQSLV